jgi:hypothetical protein
MVVKYRLKENLGSKKQLVTPAAQALTALSTSPPRRDRWPRLSVAS